MSNLFKFEISQWDGRADRMSTATSLEGGYIKMKDKHIFYSILSLDIEDPALAPVIAKIKRGHYVHIFTTWRSSIIPNEIMSAVKYFHQITGRKVTIHWPKYNLPAPTGNPTLDKNLETILGTYHVVRSSKPLLFKYNDEVNGKIYARYDRDNDVWYFNEQFIAWRLINRGNIYAIRHTWNFATIIEPNSNKMLLSDKILELHNAISG